MRRYALSSRRRVTYSEDVGSGPVGILSMSRVPSLIARSSNGFPNVSPITAFPDIPTDAPRLPNETSSRFLRRCSDRSARQSPWLPGSSPRTRADGVRTNDKPELDRYRGTIIVPRPWNSRGKSACERPSSGTGDRGNRCRETGTTVSTLSSVERNSAAGSAGDRFVPVSSPMESCPKIELRSLKSAFDGGERAVRFARLRGVGTI